MARRKTQKPATEPVAEEPVAGQAEPVVEEPVAETAPAEQAPPVGGDENDETAELTLKCAKAMIVIPREQGANLVYRFGDVVAESEVLKLPRRLHRWFR